LYDKNFKLINKIGNINGRGFTPTQLAYDEEDNRIFIQIIDYFIEIYAIDLKFNVINTKQQIKKQTSATLGFPNLMPMCYKNKHLYLGDYQNRLIEMFSTDLLSMKILKVDFNPNDIKTSNSMICVTSGCGIYFYELLTLIPRGNFNHSSTRISEINSCFYEINPLTRVIFCYDEFGILKDEISLENLDIYITNIWDNQFIEFNGTLVLISKKKKKIIKFLA
jgi:hypothetical protein